MRVVDIERMKFRAGDYCYSKRDKRIMYRVLRVLGKEWYDNLPTGDGKIMPEAGRYAVIRAREENEQKWGHHEQRDFEEEFEPLNRLEKLVLFGEV